MTTVVHPNPTSWQTAEPAELLRIHQALWTGKTRVKYRNTSYYVHTVQTGSKFFHRSYIGPYSFVTQNTMSDTSPWSQQIREFNAGCGNMRVTWVCPQEELLYLGVIITKEYIPERKLEIKIVAFNENEDVLFEDVQKV